MNTNIQKSESISNLIQALIKASAKIKNPEKDSINPHHGNKFASLGSFIQATKPHLLSEGLVLIQGISGSGSMIGVDTMLAHSSGEFISISVLAECYVMKKEKGSEIAHKMPGDGQAIGSLTTYLRRYSYASLLNLVGEEDDDAEMDRASRHGSASDVGSSPTSSSSSPAKPRAEARASTQADGDPGSAEIMFGKHKGKTLAEVWTSEPAYIEWLAEKRELKPGPDGKPWRNDLIFTEKAKAFLASKRSAQAEPIQAPDDVPF